jgi:hypothetical protein
MDIDWCTCGKQLLDSNALYCSNECAAADNKPQSINSNKSLNPQAPPINLHFSITITPNIYKASDSNAKVLSSSFSSMSSDSNSSFTSICTLDQDFNENYNYVCTRNRRYHEDVTDDDYFQSYYSTYSTSNPIDIPSPRTQAASDPALEPNKGTFGKEKSIF